MKSHILLFIFHQNCFCIIRWGFWPLSMCHDASTLASCSKILNGSVLAWCVGPIHIAWAVYIKPINIIIYIKVSRPPRHGWMIAGVACGTCLIIQGPVWEFPPSAPPPAPPSPQIHPNSNQDAARAFHFIHSLNFGSDCVPFRRILSSRVTKLAGSWDPANWPPITVTTTTVTTTTFTFMNLYNMLIAISI